MIVYVLTEPAQPLSLQFILAIVLVATHHYDVSETQDDLTLPIPIQLPIPIRYCINDFDRILKFKVTSNKRQHV